MHSLPPQKPAFNQSYDRSVSQSLAVTDPGPRQQPASNKSRAPGSFQPAPAIGLHSLPPQKPAFNQAFNLPLKNSLRSPPTSAPQQPPDFDKALASFNQSLNAFVAQPVEPQRIKDAENAQHIASNEPPKPFNSDLQSSLHATSVQSPMLYMSVGSPMIYAPQSPIASAKKTRALRASRPPPGPSPEKLQPYVPQPSSKPEALPGLNRLVDMVGNMFGPDPPSQRHWERISEVFIFRIS
jgi:hypothetical protein